MSTAFEYAAQQIVVTALDGNVTASVYDDVPRLPNGQPSANYPYVYVGDCDAHPFDDDDQRGMNVFVTLHTYSRYDGAAEVKALNGEIYEILHRQPFTLSGYSVVDTLFMDGFVRQEDDNATRHGVLTYRLTIQEAL
jgi:hypothetical protein